MCRFVVFVSYRRNLFGWKGKRNRNGRRNEPSRPDAGRDKLARAHGGKSHGRHALRRGDEYLRSRCLRKYGDYLRCRGHLQFVLAMLREARRLAQRGRGTRQRIYVTCCLGDLERQRGNFGAAWELFEQTLAWAKDKACVLPTLCCFSNPATERQSERKTMAQILRIGATDIEQALSDVTRQYLVGKLGRPQALRHIPHDVVEIGVTRYGPQGGTDAPHMYRHRRSNISTCLRTRPYTWM
jgi:hypothetical protein